MSSLPEQIALRRTFAIISHPDAGKTTLTEKLLLFGGAIRSAGSVKSRKATRHATSDWMTVEQERGISVTSSVMQFTHAGRVVNLLDTPGHAEFSEDTYRVLTAVDSAIMVVDCVKGVEERTIKLMEVCRLRDTPIISFINKLDREGRSPVDLLDEIERVLSIECAPVTWPIGMGSRLKGVYHLLRDEIHLYESGLNFTTQEASVYRGLDDPGLADVLDTEVLDELRQELELLRGASHAFDREAYLAGLQTPVFFGSAVNNFGIAPLLDFFVDEAPAPLPRKTTTRVVQPDEALLTGFVFKIQANMDPKHRDRVAFVRICSGQFEQGRRVFHVRSEKHMRISDALTFLAADRDLATTACAGDIVGIHNHGAISVGDTLTEGEVLQFTGIPHFAPELFRRVRLADPLRMKQLIKGLEQLSEEGATQFFRPLVSMDLILGAVGVLQFEVTAYRLKHEYGVEAIFEDTGLQLARWVTCTDEKHLQEFSARHVGNLARDAANAMVYLAPSRTNLALVQERFPQIGFAATRELQASAVAK